MKPPTGLPFILLRINHSDKNALKKGSKIRVIGYQVSGDDGGTRTDYKSVQIPDH
jgi:hypothetical protein